MLFSDIEGSTALLSRLGDQYREALSGQRAMLRAAIDAWHGREMGTEGDSFYVICESASDAVECCIAAQRALAAHGRQVLLSEATWLLAPPANGCSGLQGRVGLIEVGYQHAVEELTRSGLAERFAYRG